MWKRNRTFVSKPINMSVQNELKLSYEEFMQYVWDNSGIDRIVSVSYQMEHEEFIRSITFDVWNVYNMSTMSERVALKMLEIYFFNLFRFKPSNENIQEIRDNYNHF